MLQSTFWDKIKFLTQVAGPGNLYVGAPIPGCRSPNGVVPDGSVISYSITTTDYSQFEWGQGTYHAGFPPYISRDTPYGGSGPTPVNFTDPPVVEFTILAEDLGAIGGGSAAGDQWDIQFNNPHGTFDGESNFQWVDSIGTAAAPTVTPHGATGTTTYQYQIVARSQVGQALPGPATTITNGPATLTSLNYNQVTWPAVPGAAFYDVYRNQGGPNDPGRVARNLVATTFNDQDNSTAYPSGGDEYNSLADNRSNGLYVNGNSLFTNGYIYVGKLLNEYSTPASDAAAVGGLWLKALNPDVADFAFNHTGVQFTVTQDIFGVATGDSSNVGMAFETFNTINGDNWFNSTTQAKTTVYGRNLNANFPGAGQKFLEIKSVNAFGMGDAFLASQQISHSGGPIQGDEGCGFTPVCNFAQTNGYTVTDTIGSVPTPSGANTTTTQSITASVDVQTVTVASTTGIHVGDWVIIEQSAPSSTFNLEAVLVTAVGAGTISGQFRCNHANGVTVTPALLLKLTGGGYQFGQWRWLVNLSGASYSTGTISSAPAAINGSGTAWANNMVGGNATNIGVIALTADDVTSSPFSVGTPLKSWWQIQTVNSTTQINVYGMSVVGPTGYYGQGSGGGAYTIRPAARMLYRIESADGDSAKDLFVCEQSTHVWTPGDTIECATCPWPDVTGYQYHLTEYTPAGIRRGFMDVQNWGMRTYQVGFNLSAPGFGGNNPDAYAYAVGYQVGLGTGLNCAETGFKAGPDVNNGFVASNYNARPGAVGFHSSNFATGLLVDNASTNGIVIRGNTLPSLIEGFLTLGVGGGVDPQLNLKSAFGGTVEVTVPSSSSSYTFTLPPNGGTNTYVLQTNGSGSTSWVPQTSGTGATPGTPLNSVQYNHPLGSFAGAAHTNIDASGQINVDSGFAYRYNGTANALFAVPNVSGDNFFEGEAGNFTCTGFNNFGTGSGALAALTSGFGNLAVGSLALNSVTTGQTNTGLGGGAGQHITTGVGNVILGSGALGTATNPQQCTAIGGGAMGNATGGTSDVAIGASALRDNTTGVDNFAVGASALLVNTTGNGNTAIGHAALGATTTAANTAVGNFAGSAITGGSFNVVIGVQAGQNIGNGTNNVAVGDQANSGAGGSVRNVAVGYNTLAASSNGGNTAVGANCGQNISSGSNNTCIGLGAGNNLTTGSNNIIIGDGNVLTPAANVSNVIMIGINAVGQMDYNLTNANQWTLQQTNLANFSSSLTNGAAANTATLTNAPVAGNPTKWVPINDNGTTRYIPAW